PFPNRATDAPYHVLDGNLELATVRVNQQLAPAGFAEAGAAWQDLGGPYDLQGNTLVVRLSDDADGYLIADGVRIERISDLPAIPAGTRVSLINSVSDPGTADTFTYQWSVTRNGSPYATA